MTWPTEEQVARLWAHLDRDWEDRIGDTDHEHSVDCANWEPYTFEARALLALFSSPAEEPAADLNEQGRKLASQRDDLIAQGVDPGQLAMPIGLLDTRPTVPIRGRHSPHCNPGCLPATHNLGGGPHEHHANLTSDCEWCE